MVNLLLFDFFNTVSHFGEYTSSVILLILESILDLSFYVYADCFHIHSDLQICFLRLYLFLGQVNSVRLPRHVTDRRLFCGTALIELSSEEDAAKVLEQSLVYAGMELELKPK